MSKPLTPDQVSKRKLEELPSEVIDVFNNLIAKYWDGDSATIKQKDIVVEISKRLDITYKEIYDSKYLDVEPIFRDAGWEVEYDKPAYNESYDATFIFSDARNKS